jgi:hypothetical protein
MEKIIKNGKKNARGTIFNRTRQCLLCADYVVVPEICSETYCRNSAQRTSTWNYLPSKYVGKEQHCLSGYDAM